MHRTLMLALPIVALALSPAAARAGTYQVRACHGDVPNRAFQAHADPGFLARADCPGVGYDGVKTGLVARSVRHGNGGRAAFGAGAWQSFQAPAGAALESIAFRASSGRAPGCWGVGMFASSRERPGSERQVWGQAPGCLLRGGGFSYFTGPYAVSLRGFDAVRAGAGCLARAGCSTASAVPSWTSLSDVVVTVADSSPPSVAPRAGAAWGEGWHRGVEEAWAAFSDNVGIREVRGEVDGTAFERHDFAAASWPDAVRCDFARPRPCADVPAGMVGLDTRRVADGAHTLRVVGVDAAGNEAAVERSIRVDNHAPLPPRALAAEGGDAWRPANRFDVSWASPPDQVAPIVMARYRLCRGDECHEGAREGTGIERLEGLTLPGPGEWSLSVWLQDEAGNADPALAAEPIRLRLDDVAPTSPGFDPTAAGNPRRLSLTAADEHSGLQEVEVQIRRAGGGEDAWRSLPASAEPDGRTSAQVPDLELPDGSYDVRAVARDVAGNRTIVDRDTTGRAMTLSLPLRARTRLSIAAEPARARRCRTVAGRGRRRRACAPRSRRAAVPPLRLAFGRGGQVSATLRASDGRPVAGASVDVLERSRVDSAWRRVATVATDAEGRAAHRVAAGPSRVVRLAFAGDDVLLPAAAQRAVPVAAGATLSASRRRVAHRSRVAFAGRLLGAPIPGGGRTIDLQAHYRGAWRTFATPRVDRRGRFVHRHRFGAGIGRLTYRFRVLVKREAAYPYETGASRAVAVTVGG
jgi:hypothetical protein